MRCRWKIAARAISLASSTWQNTAYSLVLPRYRDGLTRRCLFAAGGQQNYDGALTSTRTRVGKENVGFFLDDSEKRIHLPHFEYGYRTEPFSWDELRRILRNTDDEQKPNRLAQLGRSVEQQVAYELYKRSTLREWNTMLDKVLCDKFSDLFQPDKEAETGKWRAHPPLRTRSGGSPTTRLVPNEFPYYMGQGIEHWVLWKIGSSSGCTTDDVQEAQEELWATGRYDDDALWWINPPHLRSLPEIDHAHILVRERRSSSPSS